MTNNQEPSRYDGIKEILKAGAMVYALASSAYMHVEHPELTGHPSADIHLGISKPTSLDNLIINLSEHKSK